jgi:DNA-directed RNA polymerase specialized sigma24 family protein
VILDYDRTKQYIAARNRVDSRDPDFEDRYQDTWEHFLRHWNGEGNPLGAFSLMYTQWYTKKQERMRTKMWVSVFDLAPRDAGRGTTHEPVYDPWEYITDYHTVMCPDKYALQEAVQNAKLTTAQVDLLLLTLLGHSSSDVSELMNISRQSVESRYKKILNKITGVLNSSK